MSFKNDGHIEIFSDERKLREFVARRPILKDWLREIV